MLKLAGVVTYYGPIQILKSLDLEVRAGEIVCLLGGNASGKSTTMKTILGIVRPRQGTVEFEGQRIDGLPTEAIVSRGISLVPEARRIFGRMTVWENLTMGAYTRRREPPAELASRTSTASTACSRGSGSGPARREARSPAASSRCSRWPAR